MPLGIAVCLVIRTGEKSDINLFSIRYGKTITQNMNMNLYNRLIPSESVGFCMGGEQKFRIARDLGDRFSGIHDMISDAQALSASTG